MKIEGKVKALSESQINQILESSPELIALAKEISPEINKLLSSDKYKNLKDISSKEEYEENFDQILSFLQKIGILGKDIEDKPFDHENYKIGPEGLSVINAFYRSKDKYKDSNKVEVISDRIDDEQKNIPRYGSFYKDFIHKDFLSKLNEDLPNFSAENEFDKIYVIAEGEVGKNHAFCVAIRKQKGDKQPIVEFFDSSPGFARSGIRYFQTMNVVPKTSAALITIATVAKSFKEKGYQLTKDNFFQNSEPFQKEGFSYCGTFAIERAYEIASMSKEEHEEGLRKIYKYDSILGGKTEIDLSLEELYKYEDLDVVDKKRIKAIDEKEKTIQSQTVAMSHFASHFPESRAQDTTKKHIRKDGSTETVAQRRGRHSETIISKKSGKEITVSTLAQDKSVRHRVRLFEILRSPQFQKLSEMETSIQPIHIGMDKYIEARKIEAGAIEQEEAEIENALLEWKYGYHRDFSYDKETGEFKVLIRCGDYIKNKIERDLREIAEVKIEDSEPVLEAFKDVGAKEEAVKRYFVDISMSNAKEFFDKLKIEKKAEDKKLKEWKDEKPKTSLTEKSKAEPLEKGSVEKGGRQ